MERTIRGSKCAQLTGRVVSPLFFFIAVFCLIFLSTLSAAMAAEDIFDIDIDASEEASYYGLTDPNAIEAEDERPVDLAEFEGRERLELDADQLTYESETGIAIARGNVAAAGNNMRITAPSATYDTKQGTITAYATAGEKIVLNAPQLRLVGESLEYNVETRAGILTYASGKMDAVFFTGGDLTVMPVNTAIEQGLLARSAKKDVGDMVVFSKESMATTCDFDHPHYRITAKRAIIFPNRKAVLKRARLYLEDRMVFQYPFDHTIPLSKDESAWPLLPSVAYDSEFGLGVGVKGPFVWDSGQLDVSAVYWIEGEWEGSFNLRQDISGNLSLFANSDRTYNKDTDNTLWRPNWGLRYRNDGWTVMFLESQRELINKELRTGVERRYDVWRSPELSFSSPWFKFAPSHLFKLSGAWGQYNDNMSKLQGDTERVLGRVDIYGEPDVGDFFLRPFYRASYRYFDYDNGDFSQKATDVTAGFRWGGGKVNLATAYVRRWVDGSSPLAWDRYYEREDLYQQITYNFQGAGDWEKWQLSVRAGYDITDSSLGEMVYTVHYNKHCLSWQLYAKDNITDNELSVGLRFVVNAYPKQPLVLGDPHISNPFGRPVPQSRLKK